MNFVQHATLDLGGGPALCSDDINWSYKARIVTAMHKMLLSTRWVKLTSQQPRWSAILRQDDWKGVLSCV